MTAKFSTGLRNKMLDTGSLKGTFSSARLRIYSGSEPATADAAATGTLLCEVSKDDNDEALVLGSAANGIIAKNTDVWSGTVLSSGTAGYWRFVNDADDDTLSTTAPRIQGNIATAGADMNLTNPVLVAEDVQPINYFAIALPTN